MNVVRCGLKPVPEILHTCFHVGINMNLSDIKTETTVTAYTWHSPRSVHHPNFHKLI
jgi:hypothetical protein